MSVYVFFVGQEILYDDKVMWSNLDGSEKLIIFEDGIKKGK